MTDTLLALTLRLQRALTTPNNPGHFFVDLAQASEQDRGGCRSRDQAMVPPATWWVCLILVVHFFVSDEENLGTED